jgi:DNA-binding transcriptional LysR family regulator
MSAEQLPHLDTFVRAAERSSFTAAAKSLGLTQAAVSQRIQALEQALGAQLFTRRGGRVLLTEAGRRLHSYAQRILALHQEARQAVTGLRAPLMGDLSLASSSVPGEHLLPGLLSAFRQRHPHVQVRATVTDSRAVLQQVEHGQAHLGLVGGKGDSPHLEYRCFACDRLVLVVPHGHPWGRRERVSLAELRQEPLILREAGSGSRGCLEQALARAGLSTQGLRVALELGSNEGIKEAVLRGLGVAVLSRQAVQRDLDAGHLHALAVEGLALDREMWLVWDRRRALPISAQLFLDLVGPAPAAAQQPPERHE